jgi:hypothetical protein
VSDGDVVRSHAGNVTPERRWRHVLLGVIALAAIGLLGLVARPTLSKSFASLDKINWAWIPLAVFAEFSSMAAVARSQRRLLRAGGTKLHLRVVAVGRPQMGTAFSFRQYGRHGIDAALAAWALAVPRVRCLPTTPPRPRWLSPAR